MDYISIKIASEKWKYRNDGYKNYARKIELITLKNWSCMDNNQRCIKSFHSVLKKEEIYLHTYQNTKEARKKIFEYIESWYNRKRINSVMSKNI